jgi:hypothetical protein
MTKFVRMLNYGSNVLDEILQVGKSSGNMKGIGFDYGSLNKEIKIPTKRFVPPKKKTTLNQGTKRNHLGYVTIVVDLVT